MSKKQRVMETMYFRSDGPKRLYVMRIRLLIGIVIVVVLNECDWAPQQLSVNFRSNPFSDSIFSLALHSELGMSRTYTELILNGQM